MQENEKSNVRFNCYRSKMESDLEMTNCLSVSKAYEQTVSLSHSSLHNMSWERRMQSLICIRCPAIWLLSGYKQCTHLIFKNIH